MKKFERVNNFLFPFMLVIALLIGIVTILELWPETMDISEALCSGILSVDYKWILGVAIGMGLCALILFKKEIVHLFFTVMASLVLATFVILIFSSYC